MDPTFIFTEQMLIWKAEKAAWRFITLPLDLSKEIKGFVEPRVGFGSVYVHATIGKTTWKTSIFPSKEGTYSLPIKAEVRKKEQLQDGDTVKVEITLQ
ncbi:MAG: DUF1905 domain-containing protein [Candidatus Gracilibacteria bacterium]|nr:DUF1905 domain-containing protein [Candidatus Gracilibacteria bacterium]